MGSRTTGFFRAAAIVVLIALPVAAQSVKVQVPTGVVELPLERYVAAVLAGESSVFQSKEALKAMAVTARTYAVRMRGRHAKDGFDFCDTTHCQRVELDNISARVQDAAGETAGEMLWFQGKLAFTPYTRDCGGRTEDASSLWPDLAAPYLKSHADPYCSRAGNASWQWSGDPKRIVAALADAGLRAPPELRGITIASCTASGRASVLDLGGVRISADSFRFAIGRKLGWNTLRSDRYQVRASNGRVVFEGQGSGHGVGLCQSGAEQMGIEGRGYREILAFYYPGTVLGKEAEKKGQTALSTATIERASSSSRGEPSRLSPLSGSTVLWERLSGDSIAMLTTHPGADRAVLRAAERIERATAERTGWTAPRIELRVYPDMDTFRDATGEPGWVAAYTQGRTIHLQPTEILRSKGTLERTLRHEIAHAFIEAQAGGALPVWFREGLASYLEAGAGSASAGVPAESDFRTDDAARARRAYAAAQAEIGELARRYGETAVFDWVKRGLPAEVAKASVSHAAPKSK